MAGRKIDSEEYVSDLIIYLGNCLIGGDEVTPLSGGGFTRDVVRFRVSDKIYILRQDREFIRSPQREKYKGAFVGLSTLTVENVTEDAIDLVLSEAHHIAELLSFATESRVLVYGHDYPVVGYMRSRQSVIGTYESFRPPFEIGNGKAFSDFVEKTFVRYSLIRETRKLNVVFDYIYHACKVGNALEIQLASSFILLENLKHTYATDAGYPFISHFFRNLGSTVSSKGPALSFEFLLKEMFAGVGMAPTLASLIKMRNELIHSGLIALDPDEKWKIFEEVQDLIREYVLRLLGYLGSYFSYTLGGAKTIL